MGFGEFVAYGALGHDKPGVGRVILQFLPQVLDVNLEVVGLFQIVPAPDTAQQGTVGHDFARVLGQVVEELVLGWG